MRALHVGSEEGITEPDIDSLEKGTYQPVLRLSNQNLGNAAGQAAVHSSFKGLRPDLALDVHQASAAVCSSTADSTPGQQQQQRSPVHMLRPDSAQEVQQATAAICSGLLHDSSSVQGSSAQAGAASPVLKAHKSPHGDAAEQNSMARSFRPDSARDVQKANAAVCSVTLQSQCSAQDSIVKVCGHAC